MFFQSNANKFLNLQGGVQGGHDEKARQKELQARYTQTNSNLNSFALPNSNSDASNLLVILQGFQMATSRSNVILVAVGGIVSDIAKFHLLRAYSKLLHIIFDNNRSPKEPCYE